MGNEVSNLVPNLKLDDNQKSGAEPSWLGAQSMNNISFAGNAAAMQSFDERGAGRRIAANLADEAYGDYEDAGGADDYSGGAYYGGGGDDAQHAAAGAHQQRAYAEEEEEAPKRYTWKEIPEVTMPLENDALLIRRAAPGAGLQRKTKKIVEQFTTKEEVFELQVHLSYRLKPGQEQQRALDLQRRAIEKVLLSKHSHMTKKGKEELRLHAAISEAKSAAVAVSEYATHSSAMFQGYDEWARKLKS